MNNTNILLIHIGMPKTGTTALQNFLLDNNAKLAKYGWSYPILSDGQRGELGEIELSGIKRCGNGCWIYESWILDNIESEWDAGMDIVLRHLENKNVIISEETIYEYGTEKFIMDAKKKYENIKVVIYLRRQDRAIESRYNQHIKSLGEESTFIKFIESDGIPEHYLDYALKLDSISKIIGRENLIVRVYEKQQLVGNDIITDFLSILGIPSGQDDWEKSERMNLSLGGNFLEISKLINSMQSVEGILEGQNGEWSWSDRDVKKDFIDVCTKLSSVFAGNKGEFAFFTQDERKEFLEKYKWDNEKVARKYLHRENGSLFYDDRMDFPLLDINQSSSFEADMIRLFAAMMYVQDQRFRRLLAKKSNEVIGKLLMKDVLQKSKGRKLLLFGAGYNCKRLLNLVWNMPVELIADNDIKKQGEVINGIQVRYAKHIADWQEYFAIVTCQRTDEIEEQLCAFGLTKEKDYILMKEYSL